MVDDAIHVRESKRLGACIHEGLELSFEALFLSPLVGPITTVQTFRCDFMQRGGNVMVNSSEHEFSFLAAEKGETYIRINSIPLRFTRTGHYTLEVTQSPWLR